MACHLHWKKASVPPNHSEEMSSPIQELSVCPLLPPALAECFSTPLRCARAKHHALLDRSSPIFLVFPKLQRSVTQMPQEEFLRSPGLTLAVTLARGQARASACQSCHSCSLALFRNLRVVRGTNLLPFASELLLRGL